MRLKCIKHRQNIFLDQEKNFFCKKKFLDLERYLDKIESF